jgi:hypothetical protein
MTMKVVNQSVPVKCLSQESVRLELQLIPGVEGLRTREHCYHLECGQGTVPPAHLNFLGPNLSSDGSRAPLVGI